MTMRSNSVLEPVLPTSQTFALKPLTLSVDPATWCAPPVAGLIDVKQVGPACCCYCGVRCGRWQSADMACALCVLALHLERPEIDEEAMLIWAPEISQAGVNMIMRKIHIMAVSLGENVDIRQRFVRASNHRRAAYCTYAVLAERATVAAERLGSALPSELGLALLELSPPARLRRRELLHGLRLLPLGHFYEGRKDIYLEIAAFWARLWIEAGGDIHAAFDEDVDES